MDIARTALVVIDLQNGFVDDSSRHVVPAVVNVVKKWSQAGGAIVCTRFTNEPDSQYERLLGWSAMMSSPETDFVDELAPFATTIVDKHHYSFFNDAARDLVAQNQWDTFVFCGIATDSCVMKSSIDAFELGYTPWVLSDVCASHGGNDMHEAALLIIKRNIGHRHVIDVDLLWWMLPIGS